eukprot:TRINITY_DN2504_c0_g1_i4.p1 TRINITY_DN2504_c0_g1~~TRINITY_DN2504_c0_g1_i4.p1  ORF type:complete len:211 (+),score=70.97 TRINITY_DN2504_c0_g1_i4:320-952(+)
MSSLSKAEGRDLRGLIQMLANVSGTMHKFCLDFLGKTKDTRKEEPEEDETSGKKKRKKKKERDPNAPKKPSSAYILFFRERRNKFMQENPNLKPHEVTKMLGKEWRDLNEKDRVPFLTKAKTDRAKYKLEKDEYDKSHGGPPNGRKRKKTNEDEKEGGDDEGNSGSESEHGEKTSQKPDSESSVGFGEEDDDDLGAVSYTHLTLPTIYSV